MWFSDMPENFNASAVYKEKQVLIHTSTEKVFPELKCNTTHYKVRLQRHPIL